MNQEDLETLLEFALHALVSDRCIRAYKHEVRNGLQGVYGGIDALIRHARAKSPTLLSLDRTIEFVRDAVKKHETSLDKVIGQLASGESEVRAIPLSALFSELTAFLSSEAARHGIRLEVATAEDVSVRASPSRLRLILLGLITDAIDALPGGGEIRLSASAREGRGVVDIADTRAASSAPHDPWALDLTATPLLKGILMPAARASAVGQGGQMDCESRSGGGRVVRLYLPLA